MTFKDYLHTLLVRIVVCRAFGLKLTVDIIQFLSVHLLNIYSNIHIRTNDFVFYKNITHFLFVCMYSLTTNKVCGQ